MTRVATFVEDFGRAAEEHQKGVSLQHFAIIPKNCLVLDKENEQVVLCTPPSSKLITKILYDISLILMQECFI